jgi:ethanolamine ammonia-lyase large subunit
MYGAARMPVTTRARTTLGQRGRLATTVRTGHPRDDLRGITAVIYEGLAYGCGDALIAVDPGADDPASVRALLDLTHDLIARLQIPTQNCVLAGPMTQIRALAQGAPLDLFFQRLAGTEAGLRALGTSVTLLDDARALAHERGALRGTQVLYLTAGQGGEAGAGAIDGVDQTTRGARALALARRYNPLLVEIAPGSAGDGRELVRAALEDHFIGKLLGVPLGVDAAHGCDGGADHNDGDLLACALATAGAQHLAVAPAGDDVVSGSQCASFHDAAALRQMLGLRPAPEFEAWLAERGLMADGRLTGRAGDPGVFLRG